MPLDIADARPMDDRAYDALCVEAGDAAGLANLANARLVAVVARCVAERWWELQQTTSPEHWCRVILGVSAATAGRLVRVARELVDYPKVAERFAEGRMTLDQVEVIVTTAHPMYDRDLVDAGRWPIHRLRRVIANYQHAKPRPVLPSEPEPAPDGEADEPEPFTLPPEVVAAGWDADGRFVGRLDLGPELGALWERSMKAARDALFHDRTGLDAEDDDRTQEASRCTNRDVLARLLHAALDGLDPNVARGARPSDRTQVVVHLDAGAPDGARIHLGPLLPTSVRRQLTCDADLRAVLEVKGVPIETWRRRRVVNRVLRLLIEDRDGGCVVEGCGRKGFLHVHHLWHWEDGGPTVPSNLCCLCPEHHRMVHAGLLFLVGDPEAADGLVTLDRWRRPWPRPGPLPPSETPVPASFPSTVWGGRLRLN